jgi:hypothetical protein
VPWLAKKLATDPKEIAGPAWRPRFPAGLGDYIRKTLSVVLQYIGRNLTSDLDKSALAKLSRQSVNEPNPAEKKGNEDDP